MGLLAFGATVVEPLWAFGGTFVAITCTVIVAGSPYSVPSKGRMMKESLPRKLVLGVNLNALSIASTVPASGLLTISNVTSSASRSLEAGRIRRARLVFVMKVCVKTVGGLLLLMTSMVTFAGALSRLPSLAT